MRTVPPVHVRRAFGVRAVTPVALAGGRGTAWRAGEVVLKPLDMSRRMLEWQAGVLGAVDADHRFRVAPPLRTDDGRSEVDGWTAWPYLPGRHEHRAWQQIIDAGVSFHDAVRGVAEPGFTAHRTDPWAIGDRVAWGELDPGDDWAGAPMLERLLGALRPVSRAAQLIHGDLTGNVLLHPELPPAVIDLSPYWRPPGFASAVVVADALVWEGAGRELLEATRGPGAAQYLLRALVFRLVTDVVAGADTVSARYGPAVDLACSVAGSEAVVPGIRDGGALGGTPPSSPRRDARFPEST